MLLIHLAKVTHPRVTVGMRMVLLVVALGTLAFVSRPGPGQLSQMAGPGGDAIQSPDVSPSPEVQKATPTIVATAVLTGTPAAGLSPRAIVFAAINRMPAKYRFESSWTNEQTNQEGSRQASLISIAGEIDGKSDHSVMKGSALTEFGVDPDAGVEAVGAEGKYYAKGMPFPGVDPKLWYMIDPADPLANFLLPKTFRSELDLGQDEDYTRIGSEVLDAQPCEVYRYNMLAKGTEPLTVESTPSSERKTYTAMDKAEYVFWVCQDTFVHKYHLERQGHDPQDATSQGRALEEFHFWDMNSSTIAIEIPSDAKPMPTRPAPTPAPTVTPQITRRPATPAPTWAPGQSTPTPHPTPASNWLLADDFVDNRNGWPIVPSPAAGQSYFEDGAYHVVETGDYSYSVACSRCGIFADFVYEGMFQKVEGSDDVEFGLAFAKSVSNSYFFYINGSGHWIFYKYTSSGWQTIKDWAPEDAINKGNARNKLRVVSSGPDFNFYINDRWVGQAIDDTLPPGRIGVGVGRKGVLIQVEYVRVWNVGQ